MKRIAAFALVLYFWSVPVLGRSLTGVVTEVRDGDTIHVMRNGRDVTVQLHGLDAPEPSQSYGG